MARSERHFLKGFREFSMNGIDYHRQEWTDGFRNWTEWWERLPPATEYQKCSLKRSKALEKQWTPNAASR